MNQIPHLVHLSWCDAHILNSEHELVLNGIGNLQLMNPQWQITVNTDAEIDDYLQRNLDPADWQMVKDCAIVAKTDMWRLLKIYQEGGIYMDVDRLCNVDLNTLCMPGIKCVLPTVREWDFAQDFMMSEPGNPIYAETLNLMLARRRQGSQDIYWLGAQTYMHVITQLVTGQIINTDPGTQTFAALRDALSQMPFILTVREDPPWHTVLYEPGRTPWRGNSDGVVDHEQLKRSLYAQYGLRHWTGAW